METRAMAGFQILIVEDHALHSTLASFLLEEAGHSVQVAQNAEEALDVLRSFHPDLILMDLEMPGQDGVELTRELRLNPIHVTTPIIALTAYTDRSDLARAHQAGCDGHISKPIDTATFARQVRDCFGGPSAADADLGSDSSDVLAEIRNNFVAGGLEECGAMLKELQANPASVSSSVHRVLHRWAGLGATFGFPEISNQARRVEALVSAGSLEMGEVVKGIETARRRFCAAARSEPKLSADLIRGLLNIRIGLVHFSEEEANRIRSAAKRANARVVIERVNGDAVENQVGYDAVVINECDFSADATRARVQWSIPAVFIGSRASLESLAALPARAYDFLIAPWEAEEILVRVYRLIGKMVTPPPTADPVHMQKRRSRILIADDDPDLVSLVWETLRQFGMDCDIARSGQQALDAVSRHRPDAILLDINMLDMDGFEILKKLRQNLSTKAIPVLLLTARNQESDIARGFECGADDYVVKPFHPWDLAKRLDKIISAPARHSVFA
jgi:two-component system cell cycle response regulator DivK